MPGSIENLEELFDTCPDDLRADAMESYPRYRSILESMTLRHGYTIQQACGVFSALSPNNDYYGNLRDVRKMMEAHKALKDIGSFTVSTYGNNKRKAWAILEGAKPEEVIVALKTRAFYHNCLNPNCPEHVCIDGHMYWVFHGRRGRVVGHRSKDGEVTNRTNAANVTPKTYAEIAAATRALAEIKGVIPCQAQAVIWQNYRVRHNIQQTKQRELLAGDLIAAGVHP